MLDKIPDLTPEQNLEKNRKIYKDFLRWRTPLIWVIPYRGRFAIQITCTWELFCVDLETLIKIPEKEIYQLKVPTVKYCIPLAFKKYRKEKAFRENFNKETQQYTPEFIQGIVEELIEDPRTTIYLKRAGEEFIYMHTEYKYSTLSRDNANRRKYRKGRKAELIRRQREHDRNPK